MRLDLTILGCGSSAGVPRVGGNWGDCDPNNPRNRRRRCSVLIRRRGPQGVTHVLIDTSPDLREQLLDADTGVLDGVFFTHHHADHLHGIDDLRAVAINMDRHVPVWADERTSAVLTERFGYCFRTPSGSDYPPVLSLNRLEAFTPMQCVGPGSGVELLPVQVQHGRPDEKALGFRIGDIMYTPDLNGIDDQALPFFSGLDVWIIDALRRRPHPSHFNLKAALAWIERMKPRRAILTNMHIDLDYEELCACTPDHVMPAYDGMVIDKNFP